MILPWYNFYLHTFIPSRQTKVIAFFLYLVSKIFFSPKKKIKNTFSFQLFLKLLEHKDFCHQMCSCVLCVNLSKLQVQVCRTSCCASPQCECSFIYAFQRSHSRSSFIYVDAHLLTHVYSDTDTHGQMFFESCKARGWWQSV